MRDSNNHILQDRSSTEGTTDKVQQTKKGFLFLDYQKHLVEVEILIPLAKEQLYENKINNDLKKEKSLSSEGSSTDVDKEELELADKLRDHDIDLEKDSDVMKEMGTLYYQRGINIGNADHFIKASALFNSALLRTSKTEKQHDIKSLLAKNEEMFLNKVALITRNANKLPFEYTEIFKEELCTLRTQIKSKTEQLWQQVKQDYNVDTEESERVEQERKLILGTTEICSCVADNMKQFVRSILQECHQILGTVPQNYAMVGLGSLGREEMTPYSDLEFVILIEDETKDKQYFRNLTNLFQLFLLNLGETPLPAVGIKSLNNFDKKNGDWFYDRVTCNGFCFDGSMPWASKTPIGRPDRKYKKGIELIQTPEKMADFTNYEFATKEGYHLGHMLQTSTLIDGSKILFEKFQMLLCNSTDTPNTLIVKNKLGIVELAEDLIKYEPMLNMHKTNYSTVIQNVKKAMYRLPTTIVNSFKIINNLRCNTACEVLEEMMQRSLMHEDACHNMKILVSISVLIRQVTYIKNGGQQESLSFLKQFATGTEKMSNIYFCDNEVFIFRYYFTMIPLIKVLLELCLDALKAIVNSTHITPKFMIHDKLYNADNFIRGSMHYKLLQNQQAISCYQKVIDNWDQRTGIPEREYFDALHSIAIAYKDKGDYTNALSYALQAKQICEQIHGDIAHLDVVCLGNILAIIYTAMGDYKLALKHQQPALQMVKQIYQDNAHPDVATSLNNMSLIYQAMGDYSNAVEHQRLALNMHTLVYGDGDHQAVATSLHNMAELYHTMGNYNLAMKHQQQALQMEKQLYGDAAHPDVVISLSNRSTIYHAMGDFNNALKDDKQVLLMNKQIYGDAAHPDVATSLGNIGDVFRSMGDYNSALEYQQQAFQMRKQIYGDSAHLDIAITLRNSSVIYKEMGDYKKALKLQNEAIQMTKEICGDDTHPAMARSLNGLGTIYWEMGHYHNALEILQQAYQMRKQIHGDNAHPDVAESLNNMARIYMEVDDLNNTRECIKQVEQMHTQIHGERGHPAVATTLEYKAMMYSKMGEYTKALQNQLQALHTRKQIHGEVVHPDIASSLIETGFLYYCLYEFDKAYECSLKALCMSKQIHGEGAHPRLSRSLHVLAYTCDKMKHYQMSLQYEIQAFRMAKRIHGDNGHPNVTNSLLHTLALFGRLMLQNVKQRNIRPALDWKPT